MIWFCYFWKKLFFALGVVHGDPFFAQAGPKNGNFQRLAKIFRTTGFQLQFLILTESPNIFHWKQASKVKKLALSLGFFHILLVKLRE